jgi:ATP-binding protein involved in chromosome partitioning
VLGRIPIYGEIRASGDSGTPLVLAHPEHPASRVLVDIARQIVRQMPD